MRVLVETLEKVIEGEIIGGKLLAGTGCGFDLDAVFTVRCDNGRCSLVHGWLAEVQVLPIGRRRNEDRPSEWIM